MNINGELTEIKSAAFSYNKYDKSWVLRFKNIKWGEFDRLILAMCLPDCVKLYDYKGCVGKTTAGLLNEMTGGTVQVECPNHQSFAASVMHTHNLLNGMHIGDVALNDTTYADLICSSASTLQDAYRNTALGDMASQKAGLILQDIVRRFVECRTGVVTIDPPNRDFDSRPISLS